MRLNSFLTLLPLIVSLAWFSIGSQPSLAKGQKAKTGTVTAKKQIPYPPEFYDAQRLALHEKKYKEAFAIFDRLDQNGFCRDKTHYYMALCLHNLNQTQAAAQHYQVVYMYSKDKRLKYLAAVGYHQVAKYHSRRTYNGQGNTFASLSRGPSLCAGKWNSDASTGSFAGAGGRNTCGW